MKYKGVEGQMRYNKDLRMFVGELRHVNDFVIFKGSTPKKAEQDFHRVVEAYLSSRRTSNLEWQE